MRWGPNDRRPDTRIAAEISARQPSINRASTSVPTGACERRDKQAGIYANPRTENRCNEVSRLSTDRYRYPHSTTSS